MNLKEKYELVCQVPSGQGLRAVAIVAGINSGQLYQWVHKYKTLGYNGLINKPKGRPLLADLLIANCCALIAEYSPSMRLTQYYIRDMDKLKLTSTGKLRSFRR